MKQIRKYKIRSPKSLADSSLLLYLIIAKVKRFYAKFKRGIFSLVATILVCAILIIQGQNYIYSQNINLTGLIYNHLSYPIYYFKDLANYCMNYLFSSYYGYQATETAAIAQNIEQNKIEIAALKLENEQLKESLKFVDTLNNDYITARIVYADISHYDARMLINAGSNSGIKPGNAVVNNSGLVGRIGEVFDNFATVYVVGDNDLRISATTINSRTNLILRGNNDQLTQNSLYIEYGNIKDFALEDGEIVITSGHGNMVPYGINIGKIYKNDRDFTVKPSVEIEKLGVVNVITAKLPNIDD